MSLKRKKKNRSRTNRNSRIKKKTRIEPKRIHNPIFFGGETNIPVLNNWKLFSYEDYLEFVDIAGTEQLIDIVDLKNSDPLKYYERMVKREYANAKR